jgi:hypothetical protein
MTILQVIKIKYSKEAAWEDIRKVNGKKSLTAKGAEGKKV